LVDDEDDRALLGLGYATCTDDREITNRVVINPIEMRESEVVMHFPHVSSNNGAIGTTVNERAVPSLCVTVVRANLVWYLV
jgi:hypothetical protein